MASARFNRIVGIAVASTMLASSTAVAAAGSGPAAQQISPWATLTVLTGGAPAAAVCGAAAGAAAQPVTGCVLPVVDTPPPAANVPPPPPPPMVPVQGAAGYGITPLLLGLVAIAAAIGFYLAVHGHGHHNVVPVSPG